MKRVLIPTDFTIKSLQLLDYAILNYPKEQLAIVLVSGYRIKESLWDMRNFSEQREINKLCSEEFTKSKRTFLREHRDVIDRLNIHLFSGHNMFAFKNFLKQNDIKEGIITESQFLSYEQPNTFDPSHLMKSCLDKTIEIPLATDKSYNRSQVSVSTIYNL